MQNIKRYSPAIIFTLLLSGMLFFGSPILADNPPPPPSHGETGNQVPGGGSPIGSGLLLLVGLGAVYGGKKIYDNKKNFSTKE